MNRNNYVDDEDDDYYRRRDRGNSRDYGHSRRRRSRSRSRDNRHDYDYRDVNEEESHSNRWNSSSDRHYENRRNRDRNDRSRDRRDYEKRDNYRSNRHYESDDYNSDGGSNNFSTEPNNKVIVRGLAQHITEADIQCDLIQSGLKPISIRLIRKKSTGASRGFAFVTFSSLDEAKSWIEKKQGVLILQDQYRAILQYSFTKDSDAQWDKVQTDWYCGKCGVFNFKRRAECFKCSASREESGSEGFDEISSILTKKIMFRNLDALTTEEKVLIVLQDKIPNLVAKISKILICRDPLTQISRGVCYLNFDNLVDSMNTFQALEKLNSLEIDGREVSFSYCVDSENRVIAKAQSSNGNHTNNGNSNRRENVNSQPHDMQSSSYQSGYQYTLADVPKLAEQAANMYAQSPAEKDSYIKYYTDFYTNQISAGSVSSYEANSGASIAQSAIERKQKMKAETYTNVETPSGTDGKKYPTPDINAMSYDPSGYLFDKTTNLFFDQSTNYFYNSEIGQYLYWDAPNSTYVLATTETEATKQKVSTAAPPPQQPPPPPPEEPKDTKKVKDPQDKVKVAKNIVKDMEKWAKKLNSKKDYTPIAIQQQMRNENSSSPVQAYVKEAASDICFSLLEKKERMIPTMVPSQPLAPYHHHSDSDDNEDQAAHKSVAASNAFNENDLVDFEKLTCLLCKRAFQSVEILSKHTTQSNLHKENLQKYKLQNGILDMDGSGASIVNTQVYRDRAKERRLKYGEADPLPPVNRAKERFQREMEKKASIAQSYQAQTLASRPIDDSNKGSKLLKAMGWKEGSGLGKKGQGRTDIIEAEQRVSSAGLGSKNASYGAGPGDDYKSYIKKMMKKRYEEVN